MTILNLDMDVLLSRDHMASIYMYNESGLCHRRISMGAFRRFSTCVDAKHWFARMDLGKKKSRREWFNKTKVIYKTIAIFMLLHLEFSEI